jgi:hypothetical protein
MDTNSKQTILEALKESLRAKQTPNKNKYMN